MTPSKGLVEQEREDMSRPIKAAFDFSAKLRQKRFTLFKSLVRSLHHPLRILDLGGTQSFWETIEFAREDVEIVLLNISAETARVTLPNFTSVVGDARDLSAFADHEFDVVFSNSVIEHVGDFYQQRQMAAETQRVGKRLFLQTPNRYFPIESHFFFPFFQFLPLRLRLLVGCRFDIGWFKHIEGEEKVELITSLRLLSEKELHQLFPRAVVMRERFLGLTKSFTLYEGWEELRTSADADLYPFWRSDLA